MSSQEVDHGNAGFTAPAGDGVEAHGSRTEDGRNDEDPKAVDPLAGHGSEESHLGAPGREHLGAAREESSGGDRR